MKDLPIIVTDIDGVFNTGQLLYNSNGKQFKVFGAHDHDGVKMLKEAGFDIIAISADVRGWEITKRRIEKEMGLTLYKVSEKIRTGYVLLLVDGRDFVYIGDGIHDIKLLRKSKLGLCPKNAFHLVKKNANIILNSNAGQGAFLDAAIQIIKRFSKDKELVSFLNNL